MADYREEINALTEQVIGQAYRVHNYHGGKGHKEKIYENSLIIACRKLGLKPRQQVHYPVYFEGEFVGDYIADLVMNDLFLIEAKAVKAITEEHIGQCLTYLKASGLKLCLILNFGTAKVEVKRVVADF